MKKSLLAVLMNIVSLPVLATVANCTLYAAVPQEEGGLRAVPLFRMEYISEVVIDVEEKKATMTVIADDGTRTLEVTFAKDDGLEAAQSDREHILKIRDKCRKALNES